MFKIHSTLSLPYSLQLMNSGTLGIVTAAHH